MTEQAAFTIREAAKALGVSIRTVRRRIKDGELSALKTARGQQDVWVIQGADLAAYAQSAGYSLTMGAEDDGQEGANAPSVTPTGDGSVIGVPPASDMHLATMQAAVEGQREAIDALREDRKFLRDMLERMTMALPSADETRRADALEEELEGLKEEREAVAAKAAAAAEKLREDREAAAAKVDEAKAAAEKVKGDLARERQRPLTFRERLTGRRSE